MDSIIAFSCCTSIGFVMSGANGGTLTAAGCTLAPPFWIACGDGAFRISFAVNALPQPLQLGL